MTIQRTTVTHAHGRPLEEQAIYFHKLDGTHYRLTHYEMEDSRLLWVHGYREAGRQRFYASLTPDECDRASLSWLDVGSKTGSAIRATSLPGSVQP